MPSSNRIRQREIGNGHNAPEQCWRKHLEQFWRSLNPNCSGSSRYFGSRDNSMISSLPTLVVRMIKVVLEVDAPAVTIFHDALVEHLEENLMHAGWAFSTSSSRITL